MNQGFKLRFDQLRDNDLTGPDSGSGSLLIENYPAPGHTRNVCLVWPDGRRFFLNYAYLIAGEFEPNGDRNLIRLIFSSHSVALKGYSLETLFMELLDHLPRMIKCADKRYAQSNESVDVVVTDIIIENKEP